MGFLGPADRLTKRCKWNSSSKGGQAGCKVASRKSNKNESKGAISCSLNDSFFHETSQQFTDEYSSQASRTE